MTYTLWDKTSPIYGITAEQAIKNNPLYGTENSYLLYRDDGSIYDILPISTIRTLAGLEETATDDDVCNTYITKLTTPEPTPIDEVTALKTKNAQLEAKVKALTESSQMLEDCLVEMAEIVYA